MKARLQSSLIALCFVVLAGCSRGQLAGFPPRLVSGSDVADRIEVDIGAMLAAHHPNLRIGRADCPFLMDLSGARPGRCTLTVSGTRLPIEVSHNAFTLAVRGQVPPVVTRNVSVSALDEVVDRKDAERDLADLLETTYLGHFTVRCPPPAIHFVEWAGSIRCALAYRGGARIGSVMANVRGGYLSESDIQDGHPPPLLFDGHAALRTRARVIDGRALERYAAAIAGDARHGELARSHLIGSARCPARIVLSQSGPIYCKVTVGSRQISYHLAYLQTSGFRLISDSVVEPVDNVRELSTRYYERALPVLDPETAKLRPRLWTDCGDQPIVVVARNGHFACTLHLGARAMPFNVNVRYDSRDISFGDALH